MICPYCGEDTATTMEHFFPQSIAYNEFDFYACKRCNHLKRSHIIYPTQSIFKTLPSNFSRKKFEYLWSISGYNKYTLLVPWRKMRSIFDGRGTFYDEYSFDLEEEQLYEFDKLRYIIECGDTLTRENHHIQALVLCERSPLAYLIHDYSKEFDTYIPGVMSMNLEKYVHSNNYGYRVCGTGKNFLWEVASAKDQYFRRLLW